MQLPALVGTALTHVSNLMLPMGMLVIGQRLAGISLPDLVDDRGAWLAAGQRLLVFPLLLLLVFRLAGVRGVPAVCALIGYCAPAASSVSILAIRYRQDVALSVKAVSLQMVCSLVTMPFLIALAYSLLL